MSLSIWEQELIETVNIDRLMDVTRSITRWVCLSGSDDEMQALLYVRGLLQECGLQTEMIRHDAYISLPGRAEVILPNGTSLDCITHSFSASTDGEGLLGDVADGAVDGLKNVRGKIALIDGLAMPSLVLDAERAGAIGQIYVNGPLTHEMVVSPVWGSPDRARRAMLPRTPIVSVTSGSAVAIRAVIASDAGQVRIRTKVATGWRETPILTATLDVPGNEEFVLLSGHIDSWHHGAMDNGTANAAMVEIARLMAAHRETIRRGLRLAFWSGHSHGRYSGSAWYADTHWLDLYRHCVAHVNVDSIGGDGAVVLTEGIVSASTRELGAEIIREVAGTEFRGSRVGRSGDQSFTGLGIPSLWMTLSEQPASSDPTSAAFSRLVGGGRGGGLGWWWHTTEDTIDKIDPDFLLRDTRIYLAGVARILCSRLLPLRAVGEARELQDLLVQRQAECHTAFDLSPVLTLAADLVHGTDVLDAWARDHGADADEEQVSRFNETVTSVCRCLIPVNYTAAGPFDHDPALSMSAIPILAGLQELGALPVDSDDARFLKVELTRAMNRIVHALTQALDAVGRTHLPGTA